MNHEQRTESRQLNQACAKQKAAELWATFDANEQKLVRFGMFPHDKMQRAEAELIESEVSAREAGYLLSVALMEIAESNGGMIA